jgi:TonB family protein
MTGTLMLNEAAIEAARQFKFKPGKQKDKLVKVWVSIPFNFSLR